MLETEGCPCRSQALLSILKYAQYSVGLDLVLFLQLPDSSAANSLGVSAGGFLWLPIPSHRKGTSIGLMVLETEALLSYVVVSHGLDGG